MFNSCLLPNYFLINWYQTNLQLWFPFLTLFPPWKINCSSIQITYTYSASSVLNGLFILFFFLMGGCSFQLSLLPLVVWPESVEVCHTCSSGLPNRMRNWIHRLLPSYVPRLHPLYLEGRTCIEADWQTPEVFIGINRCVLYKKK